jgi:WD40 repeat protein
MRKLSLAAFFLLFFNVIYAQDALNERLLEAVKHNNLDSVKILLAQGADVNYTDSNKAPVLMWAAYKADLKMVKYLVSKGADVTKKGVIDLGDGGYYGNLTGIAAGEGKLDILKFLIEDCKIDVNDKETNRLGIEPEDGWDALDWSISNKNLDEAKYLIRSGAVYMIQDHSLTDFDYSILRNILRNYLFKHPTEINEQNAFGETIITRLIKDTGFKGSEKLINDSADVNMADKSGNTPLHYAVILNKLPWVKELIRNRANINLLNEEGKSPIFYSLDEEKADILKLLLYGGAKININDNKGKPLFFYGLDNNNQLFTNYCLDHGISIEINSPDGRTPLLYSLSIFNPQLANYLIDKGANINAFDDKGETVYQLASRRNFSFILSRLIVLGANTKLPKQLPVQLKVPLGNQEEVFSFDLTSDDRFLLASSSRSITLYDFKQKKEIRTISSHDNYIEEAFFSPNDSLICGFTYNQIFLWDTYNGEFIKCIDLDQLMMGKKEHTLFRDRDISTYALIFLNDSKNVLFGYRTEFYNENTKKTDIYSSLVIVDIQNERTLSEISNGDRFVHDLELSSDSKFVLVTYDSSFTVYVNPSFEKVLEISWSDQKLYSAHFSNDNKYIISCTSDSLLCFYDISNQELVRTVKLNDFFFEFAQSPKGDFYATASWYIKLWNENFNDSDIPEIPASQIWWRRFIFTHNGQELVYCDGSEIYSLEIPYGPINQLSRKSLRLTAINLSLDDKSLAVGSRRYKPIDWNLESGRITNSSEIIEYQTQDLSYLNQTSILSAGFSDVDTTRISSFLQWDFTTGNVTDTIFQFISDVDSWEHNNLLIRDSTVYISYNIPESDYKSKGKVEIYRNEDFGKNLKINGLKRSIYSLSVSNDGKSMVTGGGQANQRTSFADGTYSIPCELSLFSLDSNLLIRKYEGHKESVYCVDFSPDNHSFASGSQSGDIIFWNIYSGNPINSIQATSPLDAVNSISYSPDGKFLLSGTEGSFISLWDVADGKLIRNFTGHLGPIKKVLFSKDGKLAFSASEDNTIKIWNVEEGTNLATLIPLPDGEWVVTSPEGLFDASPGAMKTIYYVAGMETIDLDQLKARYYQPGLLQILLGYKDEPLRDVQGLNEIELYPSSKLEIIDNKLNIALENRGGGIGKVSLYVDDIEIIPDLRPEPFNPDTSNVTFTVDLAEYSRYFNYDTTNVIGVVTWNEEGYLRSRRDTVHFLPEEAWGHGGMEAWGHGGMEAWKQGGGEKESRNPRLFAVVAGIADYQGTKIDLRFAGKDAAEFAYALDLGAENYFGQGNVFINLFTTDSAQSSYQPTKTNITDAFARCAESAGPGDYLVVYLAGHGITYGGPDGDFYYLTQDAFDTDSKIFMDPVIRESVTISAEELTAMIDSITARKKVLILDVCAAGNAAEQIFAGVRDVPGNVTRVLDNMQDRTGIYILAGCEANASSYETTVYGQGLLAYSLLSAMKGNALKMYAGQEYVDVNTLLQYARDQVPLLSGSSRQRQTPFIKVPDNDMGYFIGMMTPEDKKKIELSQPKPVFIASTFMNYKKGTDDQHLKNITDKKLNEMTSRGKEAMLVYSDALFVPDAYSLSGFYTITGDDITLDFNILYDEEVLLSHIILTGKVTELDQFAQIIIYRAYQEIQNIAK